MRWATAVSENASFSEAVSECAGRVREGLGNRPVSLVFAFVTPHFAASYDKLHALVGAQLAPEVLVGCSGGGVIGGSEVEWSPALAISAASLPGVEMHPFHVTPPLPDLDGPPDAWRDLAGVSPEDEPHFVLLADPYSADAGSLLSGLDYAFPASPKIGGLASGANGPGLNALFLDDRVYDAGAVGVALTGDVALDTVVAQGCRPVGDLMTVTACNENVLYELDGRPAVEALQALFSGLDARDQRLAGNALFVGMLMDESSEEPRTGDFLIRNLIGMDSASGSLAVGERLQEGMRLRFHLRDAQTSAEDLEAMLSGYRASLPGSASPSGALLFSCVGRGQGLYGRKDFDTGTLRQHLGDVPVGGFFCNGEFGPVGGTTFLHGYTSSFGFFRPRNDSA
jgi:small ligand-binding sensory domain FIST